jgi:heat shock protein HslJ
MKRTILSAVLITSVVLFITACSGTKKSTMPAGASSSAGIDQLATGDWKLSELDGKLIPGDSKAMLSFITGEKKSVAGNAGCNRLSGSFELPGNNAIKFSPLATTRMACFDQNATETETKFLSALGKVNSWSIADGKLTLSDGTNVLAKFNNIKRL